MKLPMLREGSFSYMLILCFFAAGIFCTPIAQAETPPAAGDLLITEVQITGGTGLTKNDYIKIYNNSTNSIDLKNYRLVKRAKAGTSDSPIKSWTTTTIIPVGGYHLWANSVDGFAGSIFADSSTTYIISDDDGIALRYGVADTGIIIDSVGWGACTNGFEKESSLITANCDPAYSIIFKKDSNNTDIDNNFQVVCTIKTTDTTAGDNTNQTTNNPAPVQTSGNINDTPMIFSNEPYDNSKLNGISTAENEKTTETEGSNQETTAKDTEQETLPSILITELLPNPLGEDDPSGCIACGEFIELYNAGSETINLSGWKIAVDGQNSYVFDYRIIKPKTRITLYRNLTNLILQNTKGTIELFNPNKLEQTLSYDLAESGYSYTLLEGSIGSELKWVWSEKTSPGEFNYWLVPKNNPPVAIFTLPESIQLQEPIILDGSDSYDSDHDELSFAWSFGDGQTSNIKSPTHRFVKSGTLTVQLTVSDGKDKTVLSKKIKVIGESKSSEQQTALTQTINQLTAKKSSATQGNYVGVGSIAKVKQFQPGDKIVVTGVVVVPPNVFGSQYLQIVDPTGGMQVYSNKKDFPDLYIGDEIQTRGELSIVNGEYRIKTSTSNDIILLNQKNPPESLAVDSQKINQNLIGSLVNVKGKVLEKTGDLIYLDDGIGEVTIQIKENSGLKNSDFELNDEIRIIGIVKQSGTEFRILPREFNDLEIIKSAQTKVLGEKIVDSEQPTENTSLIIPAKDNHLEIYRYLLAFAVGVITMLIVWVIKLKKE